MNACRAFIGDLELGRVDVEIGLRIDRQYHEEVLRILVVTAEPVGMRHLPHPFQRAHAVEIGDRQRLGEIDLVDDDQTVGRRRILACREGTVEARQHPEDQESDEDRDNHQAGAQLLAEEILADQEEVVHAARSFSMNRPLSRCHIFCA
jgi:hypothetical protein